MNTNEIKIIGVSSLAIDMLEEIPIGAIKNTDCIICDMDERRLAKSPIQNKILLGTGKIEQLSIEKQFEIGMNAVKQLELELAINSTIENSNQIDSLFNKESKMVILTAYLYDTTSAGVTPIIAKIAKKRGLFVTSIVYTPFDFNTEILKKIAEEALKKIQDECDLVFVIKLSVLQKLYGSLSIEGFFEKSNELGIQLMKTILPLASIKSEYSDLKLFFKNYHKNNPFFIGLGKGHGMNSIKTTVELALKNNLSERESIEDVNHILLQINYGNIEISIAEIGEISDAIFEVLKKEISITISISEDISLEDEHLVIIIAN